MAVSLSYGLDQILELDLSTTRSAFAKTAPAEPLANLVVAVSAALADPVGHPPLQESVVPGDRIVITLAEDTPQCDLIVAGVVLSLIEADVEPQQIALLQVTEIPIDVLGMLPADIRAQIECVRHDPNDQDQLAYLAATEKEKNPIYINRIIQDADIVIPIGVMRRKGTPAYYGVHSSWFPRFSDSKTQKRFRLADSDPDVSRVHAKLRETESREAGWLLGQQFTLQVIPAHGNNVLSILAGESNAVFEQGQETVTAAWGFRCQRQSELVIATIEGGSQQQTWENVVRALRTARHLVEDGGAIALCADIILDPPPTLRCIGAAIDRDELIHEIRRLRSAESAMALQLASVLDVARVYLLSSLDAEIVEQTGIVPTCDPDDIIRLSHRHATVTLLPDANYAEFVGY